MDTNIGAKERVTQERLIGLFQNVLKYDYLGNWEYREDNANVEEALLRRYLKRRSYADKEIDKAVAKLKQAAANIGIGLYNANHEVYTLLRYGVNVQSEVSEHKKMVHLIDWANPMENDLQIAEEVTVQGKSDRRPDLVVYVNGIAVAVIELKRSKVHEGIRQNIRNQEDEYIPRFFTTVQLLFAGNDTEGLHYGVIKTPEKFWLRWKEPCGEPCEPSLFTPDRYPNELDRSVLQFFEPHRLLEYIHDFIIFDGGRKKTARPNQYFAIKKRVPCCISMSSHESRTALLCLQKRNQPRPSHSNHPKPAEHNRKRQCRQDHRRPQPIAPPNHSAEHRSRQWRRGNPK